MKFISEQERQWRNSRLLCQVRAVRSCVEEPAQRRVSELSESAVKLLVAAALTPSKRLLELYQELGLHAAEGKSSLNDLIAKAMVRPIRLIRKGRGGQPTVLEVLSPGVMELARRGIKPAERLVKKGSFEHSIYCGECADWMKEQGYKGISFDKTLGEKCFDVVAEGLDGSLVGVEVVLTGSAKWNSSQLLRAAGVEGIAEVWAGFKDRRLMEAVGTELKEADALGMYERKIKLLMLSEFVRV